MLPLRSRDVLVITDEQKSAMVKTLLDAVVNAVSYYGTMGAPGGSLYAAFMVHGLTLNQFEVIMDALVRIGKLRRSGNLYFAEKEAL